MIRDKRTGMTVLALLMVATGLVADEAGVTAVRIKDERFLQVPDGFRLPGDFLIAATVPTVDFARYPLYDLTEGPGLMRDGLWSHWGQGLFHSNGKVYTAVGTHYSIGSTTHIYEYDPASRLLREVADIFPAIDGFDPKVHYGLGKVHGRLSEGADGKIYFAGDLATRRNLDLFKGSHLFVYDPQTEELTDIGRPLFGWNTPSTHMNTNDMLFYAESHLPHRHYGGSFSASYHDDYRFMVYSVALGRVIFHGGKETSTYGRDFFVDANGNAFFYNDQAGGPGQLEKYDAAANTIRVLDVELPGHRIRRTAGPDRDGYLYATTTDTHKLFRFDPNEETIKVLAEIGADTPGMALDEQGGYIYYVPGGKDSAQFGSPLIQLKIETGVQKVVAFLHDVVWRDHQFHLGGTYNVICSPDGATVYIGFNGAAGEEEFARRHRFGDQAFVAVHVPAEER